ncbi:hypothetical protein A6E14_13570 [Vibrio genomosp. F10]|uniref:Uncharacterized protein n=1 Tax=Vibrio genomosp. F10 TaxID=723171 RepID=A0A1B9QWJ3_9VIBR|nr:hypothetical protein A6E14_13570 [Vibrio genomosp. F10]
MVLFTNWLVKIVASLFEFVILFRAISEHLLMALLWGILVTYIRLIVSLRRVGISKPLLIDGIFFVALATDERETQQ